VLRRRHASDPVGRAASIGLSPGFTRMLGWGEMAAALGVALGVFTQVAALVLMLVMLAPAAVASSSSEPFRYYRYHRAMDAPFARPYIG
jgi:uncharacterized membrane protein YphA (DoxX/SURF4 family)